MDFIVSHQELAITIVIFAVAALGVFLVSRRDKRPRESLDPPLLPTVPVLLVLGVVSLLSLVHIINLFGLHTGR